MNRSYRHALRRLAPAAAVLVGVGLTATLPIADAAAAPPLISFVVPTAQQQIVRADKGEAVYLWNLQTFAVASKAFEIRTHRRRPYTNPITSTLTVGEGDARTTTTLPAGLLTHVDTLDSFFDLQIRNSKNALVRRADVAFCPNSWDAARAVPDAPATSPYPQQCGSHPFALGGVFGIQRGWRVPALGDWYSDVSFSGPDGVYSLHAQVKGPWRAALGLTKVQGQIDVKLKVVTDPNAEEFSSAKPVAATHSMAGMKGMTGMTGMTGMDDAAVQSLSPQQAAREAARLRTLGHPHTPAAVPPTKAVAAGKAVTAKSAAAELPAGTPEPDLRTLPAYQIELDTSVKKKTYLDFGATVWNAGLSPLVVDGFRRPGEADMDAYQYFFDTDGKQVAYAPAGGMQWDPRKGHNHWHFKSFASYSLLDETQKNPIKSGKEAFCLAPTDMVDLTVPGANLKPQSTDLSTACGQGDKDQLSLREVLDSGWGDTYGQYLPGQSFDITRVPNGHYYIEVMANPDHVLTESNTTNNGSLRKIRIGGTPGGKRTLFVYDYQGVHAP